MWPLVGGTLFAHMRVLFGQYSGVIIGVYVTEVGRACVDSGNIAPLDGVLCVNL